MGNAIHHSHSRQTQVVPEKTNQRKKMSKPTKKQAKKSSAPPSSLAGWLQPETAPQDGTQILGDFGYPWPQVAAWNTHDEKWATANMMAQEMQNKTTDIWFETELEPAKQLKRWMPLPNA